MILMKILNQSPPPPSTINPASTQAIDAVVERALRKDKLERYPTARGLADGLISALGLRGSCDEWATKSEADIASALADARTPEVTQPKPKPAPQPKPAVAPVSVAPVNAPTRSVPASSRESEVSLQVPMQTGKTKLVIAVAIGIVVLAVILLITR